MSLTKNTALDLSYEQSKKLSRPTKSGIRIISEMSTPQIIGFVALKHRVGLLSFTTFFLSSYIAYDKFLHIFF